MWHFVSPSLSLIRGGCFFLFLFFFYMMYLLVQHCHGRELSCSTKVLPSLRKTPLLRVRIRPKEGTSSGGMDFCRSFQIIRKSRDLCYNPLGLLGRSAVPAKTNNLFLRGPSNQAGIAEFASPGILPKKKKQTCCSELSSFVTGGAPQAFPQTSVGLFTHRGTIVYLFKRFLKR